MNFSIGIYVHLSGSHAEGANPVDGLLIGGEGAVTFIAMPVRWVADGAAYANPEAVVTVIVMASDADFTPTDVQLRYKTIIVTSSVALTANRAINIPSVKGREYTIFNKTTGGKQLILTPTSGITVAIPNSTSPVTVTGDGTNWASSSGIPVTGAGTNVPSVTGGSTPGNCIKAVDAVYTLVDSGGPCGGVDSTARAAAAAAQSTANLASTGTMGSLPAAVSANTISTTLHITNTLAIPAATAYNLPTGSKLVIDNGAGISIPADSYLVLNGSSIEAGDYTIFTGPGAATNISGLTNLMIGWFGAKSNAATMTAAMHECSTLAAGVYCNVTNGAGRINNPFNSNNVLTQSYLRLSGAGSGAPDSASLPTTVVGGTVFYPTGIAFSGSHLYFARIAADTGSAVAGGPITAAFVASCTNGNTAACGTDLIVDDVYALGPDATGTCQHGGLFEGYSFAIIHNFRTDFCQDGAVFKLTKSTVDGVISRGHTTAFYLKADVYADMKDTTFSNLLASALVPGDTGTAITVQAAGNELSGITINGIVAAGTGSGFNIFGASATNIVRRPVINGYTTRGVTGAAVLASGYVDGALFNGTTLNSTGSYAQITVAAQPNAQGIVFNGLNADATSGGGYLNTLNSRIYNANINVKSQGVLPLPSPVYRATIISAGSTPYTVTNTQYAMCPNCFQPLSPTTGASIVGAWLTFSQLPVGCTPILYAWDNTQGALGVQMTISGTATGGSPAVTATGVPYHFIQTSYNSLLQVPGGNAVGLEQRGGTLACTTPAIVSEAQLEYQTF